MSPFGEFSFLKNQSSYIHQISRKQLLGDIDGQKKGWHAQVKLQCKTDVPKFGLVLYCSNKVRIWAHQRRGSFGHSCNRWLIRSDAAAFFPSKLQHHRFHNHAPFPLLQSQPEQPYTTSTVSSNHCMTTILSKRGTAIKGGPNSHTSPFNRQNTQSWQKPGKKYQ